MSVQYSTVNLEISSNNHLKHYSKFRGWGHAPFNLVSLVWACPYLDFKARVSIGTYETSCYCVSSLDTAEESVRKQESNSSLHPAAWVLGRDCSKYCSVKQRWAGLDLSTETSADPEIQVPAVSQL